MYPLHAVIRQGRIATGMKQYQAAEALGVSSVFMSKIENGRVIPSDGLLEKFWKRYNLQQSFEELLILKATPVGKFPEQKEWDEAWLTGDVGKAVRMIRKRAVDLETQSSAPGKTSRN